MKHANFFANVDKNQEIKNLRSYVRNLRQNFFRLSFRSITPSVFHLVILSSPVQIYKFPLFLFHSYFLLSKLSHSMF